MRASLAKDVKQQTEFLKSLKVTEDAIFEGK
jgi:hypothetical protein